MQVKLSWLGASQNSHTVRHTIFEKANKYLSGSEILGPSASSSAVNWPSLLFWVVALGGEKITFRINIFV